MMAGPLRKTVIGLSLVVLTWATVALAPAPQPSPQQAPLDLTQLSLAELADLKVTSVERRPELLKDTPAAVSVITAEEIGTSGATSIPALLRRAPRVHVAQLDASQWAVGICGFTNSVGRSQLGLLDGRRPYKPPFAGPDLGVQNRLI